MTIEAFLDQLGVIVFSGTALLFLRDRTPRMLLTLLVLSVVAFLAIHFGSFNLAEQASLQIMPALVASDAEDRTIPQLHAVLFSVLPLGIIAFITHTTLGWLIIGTGIALALGLFVRYSRLGIGSGDILILPGLVAAWGLGGIFGMLAAGIVWVALRRTMPLLPVMLPVAVLAVEIHP